ncbi:uncharacterized protein GIQ15_01176 [Arthroderma uncinatum]|uniref:uncharacterized protein n=1 Tax=Arthroderma uncinatum TaxID=74035 RepID=UPI00144ACC9B|nr:uncharacterized protein GIQ15_01176 [Arthroderma uncinatum]KAF3491659.1 hypothetical protein GIQ15_01176 [Arthroderma uncinatum]
MFWKRGTHVAGYVRCRNYSNLPKLPRESPVSRESRPGRRRRRIPGQKPGRAPTDGKTEEEDLSHRVEYLENVKALGKPAHVIILKNQARRAQEESQENNKDKVTWKTPTELLKDLHKEKVDFRLEEVQENLDRLRSLYNPGQSVPLKNWNDLHKTLHDGFTHEQIRRYYNGFERDNTPGDQNGWRAGTSPYMDQPPVPQGRIASRIPGLNDMGTKKNVAHKIMRECWGLSIDGEEGQLDVHFDEHPLSVLLLPTMSLMKMLAESHKVKIDVSRHLGLIRITGNKESCLETSRQLNEWASDVRSMDISPPVAHLKSTADVDYWEHTLLPWLQSEYNVSFDVNWNENKMTIRYLQSAESNAQRARQTLYLAITHPYQKEGLLTNVGNSQGAHLYPVSCPDFMKLPERQKEWVRWMKREEGDGRILGKPPASIYGKGPTKPFHTLLEMLFDNGESHKQSVLDPRFTREVITATVGQCLFEGQPSLNNDQVSFPDIESSHRTFINEVPNTLPFLDSLDTAENNDNINTFRIRLVPSHRGLEHPDLPELELELEAALPEDSEEVSVSPKIRRASAIVSSRDVDMLLPESPLDIRFNKTLYYNLFELDGSETTPNPATEDTAFYTSLHKCAEAFQLNLPSSRNQPPMPLFCNLTIPKKFADLLGSPPTPIQSAPKNTKKDAEYITGEYYIYPPVQSLADAGVSRYIYKDFDLTFGSQSMGPYLPTKTTDISLTLGLHDGERRPHAAQPNQKLSSSSQGESSVGSLRAALLPFYLRSCHLAFGFAAPPQLSAEGLDDEPFGEELFDERSEGDI